MNHDDTINQIKSHHSQRRYAMKMQQTLDRRIESFIRVHHTDWEPDLDDDAKKRIKKEIDALLKSARANEGEESLVLLVNETDTARGTFDRLRMKQERLMEKLAVTLPVYAFVESVSGAGPLGLATILAETGSLSNYPNPAKLWKRLGFAPYDGLAGSTWKRETWRPRALTSAEWVEAFFPANRYAMMTQIALWILNKQIIAKSKTEDGEGAPNGPYGEIYFKRRAHTAESHPEWTPAHSYRDAMRIMMKAFLLDLWSEWRKLESSGQSALDTHKRNAGDDASGQALSETQAAAAARVKKSEKTSGHNEPDSQREGAGSSAGGHGPYDPHKVIAARATKTRKRSGRKPTDIHLKAAGVARAASNLLKPDRTLPPAQSDSRPGGS